MRGRRERAPQCLLLRVNRTINGTVAARWKLDDQASTELLNGRWSAIRAGINPVTGVSLAISHVAGRSFRGVADQPSRFDVAPACLDNAVLPTRYCHYRGTESSPECWLILSQFSPQMWRFKLRYLCIQRYLPLEQLKTVLFCTALRNR